MPTLFENIKRLFSKNKKELPITPTVFSTSMTTPESSAGVSSHVPEFLQITSPALARTPEQPNAPEILQITSSQPPALETPPTVPSLTPSTDFYNTSELPAYSKTPSADPDTSPAGILVEQGAILSVAQNGRRPIPTKVTKTPSHTPKPAVSLIRPPQPRTPITLQGQVQKLSTEALNQTTLDQLKKLIQTWGKGKKGTARTDFIKKCFLEVLENDPTGGLALAFYKDHGWSLSPGLMYGVKFTPEEMGSLLQTLASKLPTAQTTGKTISNWEKLYSRITDGKSHKTIFGIRTGLDLTDSIEACLLQTSDKLVSKYKDVTGGLLKKPTQSDDIDTANMVIKLHTLNPSSQRIQQQLQTAFCCAQTYIGQYEVDPSTTNSRPGTQQTTIANEIRRRGHQTTKAKSSNLEPNSIFSDSSSVTPTSSASETPPRVPSPLSSPRRNSIIFTPNNSPPPPFSTASATRPSTQQPPTEAVAS